MTREEWLVAGDFFLDVHGISNFRAYEIADVGRTRSHHRTGGQVTLQAPSPGLMKNVVKLAELLTWIRNDLGKPGAVLISSWYRDSVYNESISGAAPRSIHMTGAAADIRKVGYTPLQLGRAIWENHPTPDLLGIGVYNTFTHVDVRGMIGRSSPARFGTVANWWE
jgi:hypothetical protein